jgi:hypothetical protein
MVRVMVLNANLNNISVISWLSVLLVENTINLSQVTDKLYHIILSRVHIAWAGLELRTIVVICIDCIGRFKSNYHTTTTHDVSIFRQASTKGNMGYAFLCWSVLSILHFDMFQQMICIPVETNRVPLPIDDWFDVIDFWCLTSLSAIFQPFHGDQF